MALFRRSDPARAAALDAFRPTASAVDAAQRALLAAVPTARHPGIPLAEATNAFLLTLDEVELRMRDWQPSADPAAWERCSRSIHDARAAATTLESDPPDGFEALNARLADVLSPLEEFAETERRLRGKQI